MTDLNERLAQEAAELINGGEWRDGKWYSEGHRDAWRRALKPAADRIEKLEADKAAWKGIHEGAVIAMQARISELEIQLSTTFKNFMEEGLRAEKLEAALDDALQFVSRADWHYLKDETRKTLEEKNGE